MMSHENVEPLKPFRNETVSNMNSLEILILDEDFGG